MLPEKQVGGGLIPGMLDMQIPIYCRAKRRGLVFPTGDLVFLGSVVSAVLQASIPLPLANIQCLVLFYNTNISPCRYVAHRKKRRVFRLKFVYDVHQQTLAVQLLFGIF